MPGVRVSLPRLPSLLCPQCRPLCRRPYESRSTGHGQVYSSSSSDPASSRSPPPSHSRAKPKTPRYAQLNQLRARLARIQLAQDQPQNTHEAAAAAAAASTLEEKGPYNGGGQERRDWADSLDEDDVKAWRKHEKDQDNADSDPKTLLLLHSASKSLVQSDFYRIDQQGKHIGSWASGLLDIVQRLDFGTLNPQGQYLLRFSSPALATLWADNATGRRRLASDLASDSQRTRSRLSAETSPAGRSFSLLPPSLERAPLVSGARPWVRRAYRDMVALRHLLRQSMRSNFMAVVAVEVDDDGTADAARRRGADATEKEKQTGDDVDGGLEGDGYVWLRKHVMDSALLRALLDDDAAEMQYRWETVRMREWGAGRRKKGEAYRFSGTPGSDRFVVSFVNAEDTHRFVRWWHQRRVEIGTESGGAVSVLLNVHMIDMV